MGSSTFALVTCLLTSATDFKVDALKYSSSAKSSLIASAVRQGVVKMVMPLVHPACVLSPLAEKLRDLMVAIS